MYGYLIYSFLWEKQILLIWNEFSRKGAWGIANSNKQDNEDKIISVSQTVEQAVCTMSQFLQTQSTHSKHPATYD